MSRIWVGNLSRGDVVCDHKEPVEGTWGPSGGWIEDKDTWSQFLASVRQIDGQDGSRKKKTVVIQADAKNVASRIFAKDVIGYSFEEIVSHIGRLAQPRPEIDFSTIRVADSVVRETD